MKLSERQRHLRRAVALRRVAREALSQLSSQARMRETPGNEALFHEGEPGDSVFLVIEGAVSIRRQLGDDEEVPIALRGPGEWIGEMAVLDDAPRSATAVADGRARVLEVPGEVFREVLASHPEAALDLLRSVSGRLRESDAGLIDVLRKRADDLATANRALRAENQSLRVPLEGEAAPAPLRGRSPNARRLRRAALRAAGSDVPVLLVGEAGVGKRTLARAIHGAGERADGPFLAVDCAEATAELLESEIFGHAAGALGGSRKGRPGAVALAAGGTLLLTHVEALPRSAQDLLFRLIETGEYPRLGEREPRRARVRILAASDTGLGDAVEAGGFRRDLRARLSGIRIEVPPLRARRRDLAAIAEGLLAEIAGRAGREPLALGSDALEVLALHAFPGNVEELAAELERLAGALEPGATVHARDLAPAFVGGDPLPSGAYSDAVRAFKIRLVRNMLVQTAGDRAEAARRLGLHRSNLNRILRDLGLEYRF